MKRDPNSTREHCLIDTHVGQFIVRTDRGSDPETAILFNLNKSPIENEDTDVLEAWAFQDPILFGPFVHAPESDLLTEHGAHVRRLLEAITMLSRVETPANSES
jgi:hypothetical protein